MNYLSVCTVAKDEPDIPEWVAYHRLLGVERFYIYDNGSVLSLSLHFAPWIAAGWVEVIPVAESHCQTRIVYPDGLKRSGRDRWVAFIDVDEFLLPHHVDDLRVWLSGYERHAAVGINWQMFGSGGLLRRDERLVLEKFIQRAEPEFEPNRHIKSIVNPAKVVRTANPHCFHLEDGLQTVAPSGKLVPYRKQGCWAFNSPPDVEQIQINHYFCKTREDWELKQQRGDAAGGPGRTWHEWEVYESSCNAVEDTRVLRFLPGVRAILDGLQPVAESPSW